MKTFEEILNAVKETLLEDRMKTHGNPWDQFGTTAKYWSVYLGIELTRSDAALMMELLKISRSQHGGFNFDDYQDNLGYGAIAAYCALRETEEAEIQAKEALEAKLILQKSVIIPPGMANIKDKCTEVDSSDIL